VRLNPNNAKAQKILGNNRSAIETLARVDRLEIGDEGSLAKCAVTVINVDDVKVKIIVPLEGLVDFDEEIKRIQKLIEKLEKDITGLTGRLSNENFVKNASEDVVEADKKLLEQSKEKLVSLRDALVRFKV
jgi:valyl-tRNA synthetase